MPIYSYKCSNCGYTKDVLQKYSDAPITHCPKCNMETMVKQLSAPGFELREKVGMLQTLRADLLQPCLPPTAMKIALLKKISDLPYSRIRKTYN